MSRIGPRRLGLAAGAVGLAAALLVIPSGAHAAPTIPGVRLMTAVSHVEVDRFGTNPNLFISDAVYIASVNGAFEIDAVRHHRNIELHQVLRSGSHVKVVRTIKPIGSVHMDSGLPKFFTLTLRNSSGTVVSRSQVPFCPAGGYDSQRVDPDSPAYPTYPQQCGDKLTHAMAWGIDYGWADGMFTQIRVNPSLAPDGNYPMTVAVSRPYARQLHLPAKDASTTVTLNIKTESNGCTDICPLPEANGHYRTAAIRRATIRATARRSSGTAIAFPQPYGLSGSSAVSPGLPDLVALPAHDLTMQHTKKSDRDYLGFGATIWNAGPGTFDIEGFRQPGRSKMQARQYVGKKNGQSTSMKIGTFLFDNQKTQHHWNLEDVARYTLLDTRGKRVTRSKKQSFCLAPTDPVNLLRRGAQWNTDGLYSACPSDQSLWLREALPVGWGDTYIQQLGCSALNVTTVPNGTYLIRIQTNPFGHIKEVTRSNNTSYLKITLGGTPGARTVSTVGPVGAPK
jgi:hypothetical protein